MPWSLFSTKPVRTERCVEILKVYWRLMSPTRRPITCELYRTDAGLELRTSCASDLLYWLTVSTENQAADQAAAWKAAALTVVGFTNTDDQRPASTDPAIGAD